MVWLSSFTSRNTVIQYFAECYDGYYQYSSDYFPRFIALASSGKDVVIIPENASGVLHENSSDIQFVYKLKPATVSVNYLDVDGKQIINSEIIYGRVFDEYNTVPKEIDGYELVERPENASGKMTEEDISVDYIYRLMYS